MFTGIITDRSSIGINTYAYGSSFSDPDKTIKVRIDNVLTKINAPGALPALTTYQAQNNSIEDQVPDFSSCNNLRSLVLKNNKFYDNFFFPLALSLIHQNLS